MRTGHSTGRANLAQSIAGVDRLTGRHLYFAQVAVERDETTAMVNKNRFPIEEIIAGIEYDTGCWSDDRRARRGGDIHA